MNREIKFRAYDKHDKIMWVPLSIDELIRGGWELETSDQESSLPHNDYLDFAHNDTVWMQFTGLKDKNGKEIYEGDILKNSIDARLFNWLVDFHDGCFCIRNIGIDGMLLERFKMSQSLFYDREIIGNIYENPILK